MAITKTYSSDTIVEEGLAFILSKRECTASRLIRELIMAEAERLKKQDQRKQA